MPQRMIYTNCQDAMGASEWKFMLLLSNHKGYKLQALPSFNFTDISKPNDLSLQAFEQSMVDAATGIYLARRLIADFSSSLPLSSLKNMQQVVGEYCEVGTLTPFMGVEPNTFAFVEIFSDTVGLNLETPKYKNAGYQQYFAEVLSDHMAWYQQQALLHANWLQYQATQNMVLAGYTWAPSELPVVEENNQDIEQPGTPMPTAVEQTNQDERSLLTTPTDSRRSKSSSFSLVNSDASWFPISSDENASDAGYNSDGITNSNGVRKSPSRHSLNCEVRSAATSLVKEEAVVTNIDVVSPTIVGPTEEEFIPVVGRRSASMRTLPKIATRQPASVPNTFSALNLDSDNSDNDEIDSPKPSVTVKTIIFMGPKKDKTSAFKPKKQTAKQAPRLEDLAALGGVNNQDPKLLNSISRSFYDRIKTPELTEETAMQIVRVCLVYFIAAINNIDLSNISEYKLPEKIAMFLMECLVAGMALELTVGFAQGLNKHRPRPV